MQYKCRKLQHGYRKLNIQNTDDKTEYGRHIQNTEDIYRVLKAYTEYRRYIQNINRIQRLHV